MDLDRARRAAVGGDADDAFYDDLTYSTIAGYCYIRLLDDVMDDDPAAVPALLPAAGFFHAEFQRAYTAYFEPRHPFWEWFDTFWFGAAQAAIADAVLRTITLEQFRRISAAKVSPAKIPVIATLRDSQNYIRVAETGEGLFEMKPYLVREDLEQWQPLLGWLSQRTPFVPETTANLPTSLSQ